MANLFSVKKHLESGGSVFELPLRVCFYARVSTDKDEQLNSLSNQIFYFEDYIRKNENWIFAGAYVDEGLSGKSVEKRTNFLKMINDAKSGMFDMIITKEISRFSRSTLDSIKYTQELLNYGVGVYFQSDNINTMLPDSELRLTIMASIAQEEVRKLSERLRFGYKRSIEKGRVLGQNNLFGYNKEDGRLTIVEEEAEIIRKIFNMYIEGKLGVRKIARELEKQGIVSPNTQKMFCSDSIKNIILNPKYKGFYCSGKTASIDYKQTKRLRLDADEWNVYKDENIPAIVSEEIWNSANELYKIRGEKSKKNSGAYLQRYSFSGKLICAEHQTSFHRHVYKNKNGGKEVWNCKLYRQKGKHDGCDSPTIYSSELQKILDEIYSEIYDDKEKVISGLLEIYSAAEVVDYSKEISDAEKVLSKLQKTKDQLLELLVEKIISKQEFKERNDAANSAIKKNEDEISSLRSHKNTQVDITLLEKTMRHEFAKLNSEFNETLLDKIIVHKINESPAHINLEIHLNIGDGKNCISLHQIGISQAQVSRLEKNALKNMRKYIS